MACFSRFVFKVMLGLQTCRFNTWNFDGTSEYVNYWRWNKKGERSILNRHGLVCSMWQTGKRNFLTLQHRQFYQLHPDTVVINIGQFAGWSSLENAWHQVDEMGQEIISICATYPDGIHLLGKILKWKIVPIVLYGFGVNYAIQLTVQDILKEVYFHELF